MESSDAGFKPDQLYQASEINNHEFTGNVAFEAVWDINMYTVNVEKMCIRDRDRWKQELC